jgi:hypothetical protein
MNKKDVKYLEGEVMVITFGLLEKKSNVLFLGGTGQKNKNGLRERYQVQSDTPIIT